MGRTNSFKGKHMRDRSTLFRSPEGLIAEYHVLNEAVWRRGQDNLIVNSIMIPASLAIVTFSIEFRSYLERSMFTGLPNAGFIPLLSLVLIAIPYVLWYTSTVIDKVCFCRIHQIEDALNIKGNKWVRKQLRCNLWIKLRSNLWHIIYWFLIATYLFIAFWLFAHTTIS